MNIDEVEKLSRVPFFLLSTPVGRMGVGGGGGWVGGLLHWVFTETGTFLNIQNPTVLSRVSKGDQSHFEAVGASFVCEGCVVLST